MAAEAELDLLDDASIDLLVDTLAPEMRTQLLDTFEQQLQRCVEGIASAIELDDDAERRRLAHLLKGSCATLGAQRLRASCQSLEERAADGDRETSLQLLAELQATAQATRHALAERLH